MQTESLATSHLQHTVVQPVSESSSFGRKTAYPCLCFTQFPLLSMTLYGVAYAVWVSSVPSQLLAHVQLWRDRVGGKQKP